MSYFSITFIPLGLLFFFLTVIFVERKRNKRFFSVTRNRFDARVSRMGYVIEHIDWGAFLNHVFKLSIEKVAHDVVHGTLLAVRTIERTLTRAIRVLRERLAHRSASSEAPEGFEFGKTIQRFKKTLRRDFKEPK